MWQITKLSANNFLSFSELELHFTQGKLSLIKGYNKDDIGGANSNGAGKSSILSAVKLCLLDFIDSDKNKKDLIKWGFDEAEVTLTLFNKNLNKKVLIIKRLFQKKSASFNIYENDIENTHVLDSVKYVTDLLEIKKSDILNYFLISQSQNNSFFSSSDREKKDIISRLLNIDILERVEILINLDISGKKDEIKKIDNNASLNNEMLNTLKTQLEEYSFQFANNKAKELNLIVEKLIIKQKSLESKRLELETLENENKNVTINEYKIENENIDKFTSKINSLQEKISENSEVLNGAKNMLADLQVKERHMITCPNCSHIFSIKSKEEINYDELKKEISECKELINEVEDYKESLGQQKIEFNKKIEKEKESRRQKIELNKKVEIFIEKFSNKKTEIEKSISTLLMQIESLLIESENKKELIQNINSHIKSDDFFKRLKRDLIDRKTKVQIIEKELRIKQKELIEYESIKNSILINFKTYLTNKILSIIEGKINLNFEKFKVSMVMKINPVKKLAGGDFREKISFSIMKSDGKVVPLSALSGGQKMRLNLISIVTIQELINSTTKNGGLDFLFLDETFEGLDQTGQEIAVNFLNDIDKTVLIISHQNTEIDFENQISVFMENGDSRIEN